jgi:dCMP deaminase
MISEMKTEIPNKLIDFKKYWGLDEKSKPSFDAIFMQLSILMASRSTCKRAQFGAVIVKDNRVVACGYNGSPSKGKECADAECELDVNGSCYHSIHAEQNAIASATKNGINLDGASIYVKSIPCLPCAKLIVASGIKKYYLLDEDYRIKDGKNYLLIYGVNIIKLDMVIE